MALSRTAGWGGSPPGDQRCDRQPGRSEPSGERCSSMTAAPASPTSTPTSASPGPNSRHGHRGRAQPSPREPFLGPDQV